MSKHNSNIQMMPIDTVKPYIYNPRVNDQAVDAVARSIEEFGFRSPIVVDESKTIINGHTRLKAAKQLGLEQVPVLLADDLTEEQVRAFRLADNKTAELAEWDDDMLEEELSLLDDIDMSEFGFEEIVEELEVEEDEGFDDELPKEPRAQVGDVYKLGGSRLVCGDSLDPKTYELLCEGEEMDLYLTDPPYNIAYEGKTAEALTIENDDMSDEDFRTFLFEAFTAAGDVMKPGASFYIWHAESEKYNFVGACNDVDWTIRQTLIWNKNQFTLGRQDYQWKHEPCLYGWKPGASHSWYGGYSETTVLDFNKPNKNIEHPTMKPIELFAYLIKNSTKQGDNVLDNFGGSGTTIMACEQLDRHAFVIELDPKYVDVIINRWEEYTGEKAVKLNE
ncbi:DNA modification methylase [Dolosigranulum savutiense]|uniref:Methyltransferase n=1 Tax=Dolosigranulum savutiense TaxID=3110288 RepID=A0AB74TP35_9LACT